IRQEFTGQINRALMHGHLWSPSYFSASCGGAPLAIVRQYIEQQKRPLQGAGQSSPETHSSPA
ncbi:transposase, partial [Streptomyces sp. NPDC042207]|uniref:transposase n=1 Tax=Streptomyces sp. NPDC042207 TaxID=3154331 RepID=UPI0033EBAC10